MPFPRNLSQESRGCMASSDCCFECGHCKCLDDSLGWLGFHDNFLAEHHLLGCLVAGFLRVLILASPGIVKMPVFFTSACPSSASEFKPLVVTLFFSSTLFARESAMEPLVMALFAAAFFIAAPFAMVVFSTKIG